MVNLRERLYCAIFICLLYWPQRVLLYYYPTVFWCPNNCRFNLNQPDKNQAFFFKIKPGSHLFFVCPNIAIWQDISNKSPRRARMYENLMLVDEEGFKNCTVNRKNPKLNREIFRCDEDPMKFKYTEEIFSSHRAFANKMKYEFGKNYYFISTSDGTMESLNNTSGGHCRTHNMKLQIYICREDEECEFEMPKCPFNNVFRSTAKRKTTPTTTNTPSYNITFTSKSVPEKEDVKAHTVIVAKKRATTEKPVGNPVTAKQSSPQTIWGKDRKHIIIHITLSLVVLVLVLSLIYVLVSRRKPAKDTKKNGIDSELFRVRPMSLQIEGKLLEPQAAPV